MTQQLQDRFLMAILAGDLRSALLVAQDAIPRGLPFLYEDVIAQALVEVGRLWREGRVSVADEHIATAVAQSVVASLYPTFPWTKAGPKGVVACVQGEQHQLGARMVADLLCCDGWKVTYVGADLPLEALVELVVRERPVFVGLSVSMAERLPSMRETIAALRREAPGTKVLLGGRAAASEISARPLWGADAIASSAAGAVEVVRPWKA